MFSAACPDVAAVYSLVAVKERERARLSTENRKTER